MQNPLSLSPLPLLSLLYRPSCLHPDGVLAPKGYVVYLASMSSWVMLSLFQAIPYLRTIIIHRSEIFFPMQIYTRLASCSNFQRFGFNYGNNYNLEGGTPCFGSCLTIFSIYWFRSIRMENLLFQ